MVKNILLRYEGDQIRVEQQLHLENVLLTIDLCDMSTTLHSDSDVNSSKTLFAQQQHWLQKLRTECRIMSAMNQKHKKQSRQP